MRLVATRQVGDSHFATTPRSSSVRRRVLPAANPNCEFICFHSDRTPLIAAAKKNSQHSHTPSGISTRIHRSHVYFFFFFFFFHVIGFLTHDREHSNAPTGGNKWWHILLPYGSNTGNRYVMKLMEHSKSIER